MTARTRSFSRLFGSHDGHHPRRVRPELELALSRARQEQRAAHLLSSRGHLAEGLRLTLRALDSAFQAAQLASARNEPAAALRALGLRHEERALVTLRTARTLDVPPLDHQVPLSTRALMREAGSITHDMILSIERLGQSTRPSLASSLARLFAMRVPLLSAASDEDRSVAEKP